MKIGDKVRLVHGKESGIITRVIDAQQIEVEIEDGFRIPVAKREVTIIATEEGLLTGKTSAPVADQNTTVKTLDGTLQIAFQAFNDRTHRVFLINERNCPVLFSCFKKTKQHTLLIQSGKLESNSILSLDEWNTSEFSSWPNLIFQFIYLLPSLEKLVQPYSTEVIVKAEKFYKNKKHHPLLNGEANTWAIDSDLKLDTKEIEVLTAALNTPSASADLLAFDEPEAEVDLHIEKLDADWNSLTPMQIMHTQTTTFEKKLDQAIACGMDEITFIHGVGNNVLKNELHKRLSKDKRIDFFKDAKKERFGYGATLVKLK
ncbi:Smr/MutS family protein [Cytophaga aurantiaca]|uniref:Smr/MutS family protein n=1 Tax=Cytophaga aurantiaca TaxID=29530 RepID=UPI00036A71BB|nr:DUF2027 domain-containing protein [Cytophaga aurantiaca]